MRLTPPPRHKRVLSAPVVAVITTVTTVLGIAAPAHAAQAGINWTSVAAPTDGWVDVTYGNGLFVAVAYSGTGNRVMTSPDGITGPPAPARPTTTGTALHTATACSLRLPSRAQAA